jgi:hypothetical protein
MRQDLKEETAGHVRHVAVRVEAPLDEMVQEDGGLVALGDAAQHQRHPDQTLTLFQHQMCLAQQDKTSITELGKCTLALI